MRGGHHPTKNMYIADTTAVCRWWPMYVHIPQLLSSIMQVSPYRTPDKKEISLGKGERLMTIVGEGECAKLKQIRILLPQEIEDLSPFAPLPDKEPVGCWKERQTSSWGLLLKKKRVEMQRPSINVPCDSARPGRCLAHPKHKLQQILQHSDLPRSEKTSPPR